MYIDAGIRGVKVAGSTGLQLLGLAGLVDGVVRWHDFIQDDILANYQALKDLLFFWLPTELQGWPIDYFVVGCGVMFATRMQLEDELRYYSRRWGNVRTWSDMDRFTGNTWKRRFRLCMQALLFWPYHLTMMIFDFGRDFTEDRSLRFGKVGAEVVDPKPGVLFTKWTLFVLVAFLGLLFIGTDIVARMAT